ncbi:MAG: hypothetical protein LVQ97_04610 [Candidatus Micrarchaeales archaeon]|jgi:hypothetical protein|uniref:Uncharacterized protein n=1 Tax=Candidatus Micrarchaeum acidiphilum ARMAN-2 TaxID=425595 RepID=C7DH03_MICA2|nr:MAG: hypothetical protein UNLARM2_0349 [Candidatus Micrarchaeum acidiphilum ARMAN-2]MCW6161439.1 hypothetical protein [Candidatus Micrarchaeales archaeon]
MFETLAVIPYHPFLSGKYSYESLLDRLIYLDYADMKGITKEEEGTRENWVPVFKKSPYSSRYLVDGNLNILGYWHFVALKEKMFRKAKKGLMLDQEITANNVYSLEKRGRYMMYFVETVTHPDIRNTDAVAMLDESFYDAVYDFARSGVFFTERITNAVTPGAVKRATGFGMRFVTKNIYRGSIYSMGMTDFLLRNASRRMDLFRLYLKEMGRRRKRPRATI